MTELVSEIVAAYVANNSVPAAELPGLIKMINHTLQGLSQPPAPAAEAEPPKPAVPVKKSVTDDYLISLFDGRKFNSLKRHLSAEHGITPDEYRTMFGLPIDYPMVAPGYAKQRSALARSLGLGRRPAVAEAAPGVTPEPETSKKAQSDENGGIATSARRVGFKNQLDPEKTACGQDRARKRI